MSYITDYILELIERLHLADQRLVERYQEHEDAIRKHEESIFGGSLEDHLRSVKRKPIGIATEKKLISAVLNYHDWVRTSKQLIDRTAYVSLPEVLVSYEDVFYYCKMRVEELDQKTWTQSFLCRAILRMLQFIEVDEEVDEEVKGKITKMREDLNAVIAAARRENMKYIQERPSVDELREKGETLFLTDLVKVCKYQVSYYYNIANPLV